LLIFTPSLRLDLTLNYVNKKIEYYITNRRPKISAINLLRKWEAVMDKKPPAGWLKAALSKLNTVLTEDMTDYDDDADYDTRVKLPEWQLAALKKRKREQKKIK